MNKKPRGIHGAMVRGRLWERSPLRQWGRRVKHPFAFKAWRARNPAEAAAVDRKFQEVSRG